MVDDSLKEQTPYTPTMENIRNCYIFSSEQYDGHNAVPVPIARAEFDRALAAHEERVRAEALTDAADWFERREWSGVRHTTKIFVRFLRVYAAKGPLISDYAPDVPDTPKEPSND